MPKKYYAFIILCALISLTVTFSHSQETKYRKEFTWKMVSVYARNVPIYQQGMEKIANDIEVISQGQLKINPYAAGEYQGIKSSDVFDAVSNGIVEIGFGTSPYWAAEKIPGSDFMYSVPFGLSANDMYAWLYRGGGLELFREMYEPFNVIPFPVGNTGGAMGGWFNEKIENTSYFENKHIRMISLHEKVMQKLGAISEWMPSTEALNAYNNGEIQAIVCLGPFSDLRYKLYRGPKYYYYPGWQEPGGVISIIINKKAWKDLPENLQKTIEIVCGHTYQHIYNQFQSMNSIALRELQSQTNVELVEFPPGVIEEFRKKTTEVLEEEAKRSPQFDKVYQSFKKFKENNIEFGWNKIQDDAVYSERLSQFINGLLGSPVAKVHQKGNNSVVIQLMSDASFTSNSANPKPALTDEIKRLANIINDYSYSIAIKSIIVEGHTDNQGKPYRNWMLSKDRANAVVKLLTDNKVEKPIKPVFYGDAMPIADNNTPEGRRKNRRVEIIIEF